MNYPSKRRESISFLKRNLSPSLFQYFPQQLLQTHSTSNPRGGFLSSTLPEVIFVSYSLRD
jgi:hypothetical protein